MQRIHILLAIVLACCCSTLRAEEPNDNFAQATILPAGVLSVDDDVSVPFPNTVLASLDWLGFIEDVDDNSSIYGNGFASGLSGVSVNAGGTIDFLVSGHPDFDFGGNHNWSGEFGFEIEVFDFFGDSLGTFTDFGILEPGSAASFSYQADFDWDTYNINIDNTVDDSIVGDVDFFTFTGLTPGAAFTAEVTQETLTDFDSYLGWFSHTGFLLDTDDDDGVDDLSLLQGTVPANGRLTFAVTGFGDEDFEGFHVEQADYSLELTIGGATIEGDFDNDGDVDGRDFLRWQRGGSPSPLSAADLADWQANYGGGSLAAVAAVPEPGGLALVMFVIGAICLRSKLRR
jgi:hypothetical protein